MSAPDTAIATAAWWPDLARQIGRNVRLAAPVAASRLVMFLIITADVVMVGRHDSTELAYLALGFSVQGVFMLVGIGMLIGTGVLTAQSRGAGAEGECGVIYRVALAHAVGLGVLFAALCFAGTWFFRLTGQGEDLAVGAGQVMVWLGLGLPGLMVMVATSLFLEALGRPGVGVVVSGAGLALNVALNMHFIPQAGADGAAIATTLVRWAMAALIVVYAFATVEREYGLGAPFAGGWAIGRKLRRLGYALGLAQGLESAAFGSLALVAGLIGVHAVAAHQVALQVAAFCFMGAVGISTATAVQVGMAVGRGDQRGMALAGWAGCSLILIWMAVLGLAVGFGRAVIAGWFTDDAALIAVVLPTLLVVAVMLPTDGLQGVLMGALRGTGDVWIPTGMHLFSFIVIMAPLSAWFALGLDWGVPGLFGGAACGVTVAALLLALRFLVIGRRVVARL
ncbi:MAG: MATE family efflux transporter [Alphaproteobacteria bacterium]